MASQQLFVLFVFFLLVPALFAAVESAVEAPHVRAKRYEYNVQMPYSSVVIKGSNPVIEAMRTFGRLTDVFKYFG
ncbi:hypothetical protein L596_018631 [Steinernema carpocapsae]|uniref:Uncharacterized protein n=1 Tax=Steinernema carpocapsae TaxID=34508 RepID=A0A4U5N5P7_STECR|nr:hypothetical protein L596_018631 [Steinernema carpocapsae]